MIEKQKFQAYYLTTILALVWLLRQFSISRVKLQQRQRRRSEFSFVESLKAGLCEGVGWRPPQVHRLWGGMRGAGYNPSTTCPVTREQTWRRSCKTYYQSFCPFPVDVPRKHKHEILPRKHLTVCWGVSYINGLPVMIYMYSKHEICLQCRGFLVF